MRIYNSSKYHSNLRLLMQYFESSEWCQRINASIYMQDEHNIVLDTGRDLRNHVVFNTQVQSIYDSTRKYLNRVKDYRMYLESDVIIEYNIPAIVHMKHTPCLDQYLLKKMIYAPSLPFLDCTMSAISRQRENPIVSLISNRMEYRRNCIMDSLSARYGHNYTNITGTFDYSQLQKIYQTSKILVNIHQTWHHHNIEEFRVLPALSQGCIIISERVPYVEYLPYSPFIIWADYDNILQTVDKVILNYNVIWSTLYGHNQVAKLVYLMKAAFFSSMDRKLGTLFR